MFRKKKRIIAFTGIVTLAFSIASLLKYFQKEKRVQFVENQIKTARSVDTTSKDFKPAFPNKLKTKVTKNYDAGTDVAPLIAKMLEIAQKLEKLENVISNNFISSENMEISNKDISSIDDAKYLIAYKLHYAKAKIEELNESFELWIEESKEDIELARKEHSTIGSSQAIIVRSKLRSFNSVKIGFIEIRKVLIGEQDKVNIMMVELADLGQSPSINKLGDKLNELNEKLVEKIEIYDVLISGTETILGVWDSALDKFDIDGSERAYFNKTKETGE